MMYLMAVREFMLRAKQTVNRKPTIPSLKDQHLRSDLMEEELKELVDAMRTGDMINIADGLADLLYVTFGTAVVYGIPIDKVFRQVHNNNMSKIVHGIVESASGKVLKPKGFKPVDLTWILEEGQKDESIPNIQDDYTSLSYRPSSSTDKGSVDRCSCKGRSEESDEGKNS